MIISFFLPKAYYVERSVEINAPANAIYAQVSDLEAWQEWNPWNIMDPEIVVSYGEIRSGEGASYAWISEVAGNGSMRIVKADPPERADFELVFEGYEDNPSYSSILLAASGAGQPVTVTWTYEGNVGDRLLARWVTLLMDRFVGASYEKGLKSLKERCEADWEAGR